MSSPPSSVKRANSRPRRSPVSQADAARAAASSASAAASSDLEVEAHARSKERATSPLEGTSQRAVASSSAGPSSKRRRGASKGAPSPDPITSSSLSSSSSSSSSLSSLSSSSPSSSSSSSPSPPPFRLQVHTQSKRKRKAESDDPTCVVEDESTQTLGREMNEDKNRQEAGRLAAAAPVGGGLRVILPSSLALYRIFEKHLPSDLGTVRQEKPFVIRHALRPNSVLWSPEQLHDIEQQWSANWQTTEGHRLRSLKGAAVVASNATYWLPETDSLTVEDYLQRNQALTGRKREYFDVCMRTTLPRSLLTGPSLFSKGHVIATGHHFVRMVMGTKGSFTQPLVTPFGADLLLQQLSGTRVLYLAPPSGRDGMDKHFGGRKEIRVSKRPKAKSDDMAEHLIHMVTLKAGDAMLVPAGWIYCFKETSDNGTSLQYSFLRPWSLSLTLDFLVTVDQSLDASQRAQWRVHPFHKAIRSGLEESVPKFHTLGLTLEEAQHLLTRGQEYYGPSFSAHHKLASSEVIAAHLGGCWSGASDGKAELGSDDRRLKEMYSIVRKITTPIYGSDQLLVDDPSAATGIPSLRSALKGARDQAAAAALAESEQKETLSYTNGEATQSTFKKIMDAFKFPPVASLRVDEHSVVLDVGSGFGMSTFHMNHAFEEAKKVFGVEPLPQRVKYAKKCHRALLTADFNLHNLDFLEGSVNDPLIAFMVESFVTHIYGFDARFTADSMERLCCVLERASRWKIFATYHTLAELKRWGLVSIVEMPSVTIKMAVAKAMFTCRFYRRATVAELRQRLAHADQPATQASKQQQPNKKKQTDAQEPHVDIEEQENIKQGPAPAAAVAEEAPQRTARRGRDKLATSR